jgi:hypothetical protein
VSAHHMVCFFLKKKIGCLFERGARMLEGVIECGNAEGAGGEECGMKGRKNGSGMGRGVPIPKCKNIF